MAQITKYALAGSLKKMLQQTTLDKITVKELVEDCGINRQTFYYHFHDIYELLGWIFITEAENVLAGKKTYDSWQEGFLQAFFYVLENKALVVNAYQSLGREHLERYLYSVVHDLLLGVVEEAAIGLNVSDADKAFIADFYRYGFVGLVLEWIRTGMKEDPETLVQRVSQLLEGNFYRELKKFEIAEH